MSRKNLSFVVCASMVLTMMPTAVVGAQEDVTLRVLTHYDAAFEAVAEKFEEETGIKVEVEQTNYEAVNDTLEVVLGSGSSEYDIIMADGPNVAAYVNRGYLAPLSDYFTEDEINTFSPALVQQGTYKEDFYAAPLGDSSIALYYNKNLLAEAGVDVDWAKYDGTTRITWEELIDIANKVVETVDPEGTNGIYGIEFGQVSVVYQMNLLANSLGGKNLSDEGNSVEGILDGEEWKQALAWYQEHVNDGTFSRGVNVPETYNNFYAGKCVFEIMTTDSYEYILAGGMELDDFGWTYVPCFEGYEEQVATGCGNWTVGVSAFSENKEAAGQFVNFITSVSYTHLTLPTT